MSNAHRVRFARFLSPHSRARVPLCVGFCLPDSPLCSRTGRRCAPRYPLDVSGYSHPWKCAAQHTAARAAISQSVSQLFHGPTPRSPLHRLAIRLRRSRSNTSTEYSLSGATLATIGSPPEGSAAKIDIEFIFMLRVCSGKTTVTLESRGNAFLQMERRAKTRKSTTPVLYLYMI